MNRRIIACGLICVCATARAATFTTVFIHPGEKLVVNFAFTTPPSTAGGPVDFLQFGGGTSFNDFYTGGRASYVDVSLYDGSVLLGTKKLDSIPNSSCCIFLSHGSPGTTTQTVDIDMAAIMNGTINGRIEYVPFFDAPSSSSEIDLGFTMTVGRYFSYGTYYGGFPDPTILSSELVPIPTAGWLFGPALGLLALLRRRILKSEPR